MTGRVKRIVRDRGFGFIAPDDPSLDGQDIFFHMSDVQREPGFNFSKLEEGDELEFDVTESAKGPRAENITRA